MKKIAIHIILLFNCISFAYTQENIIPFDNNWTFDLSMNYNFLQFQQNEAFNCTGHKPIGVDIGARYKNIGANFTFQLPILTQYVQPLSETFDIALDYYADKFIASVVFTRYKSFYINDINTSNFSGDIIPNNNQKVDLEILLAGTSFKWILNHRNHSIRGVYVLDKMQRHSNGSFILGLGFYYNTIHSNDQLLPGYETKQHSLFLTPLAGYSYSWIFGSGFFLNADITLGVNAGLNITKSRFEFMPTIQPNMTIGYHLNTWSFSASVNAKLFMSVHSSVNNNYDWYLLSRISITLFKITKRF
jgi:hypothetical protein